VAPVADAAVAPEVAAVEAVDAGIDGPTASSVPSAPKKTVHRKPGHKPRPRTTRDRSVGNQGVQPFD
jgi:hypothetical protein